MTPQAEKMIQYLRSLKDRKRMYVQPVDLANVQSFLGGFKVACGAMGFEIPHELDFSALEQRGWKWNGLGPVPQMRDRGMSDEAIMDELIEINVLKLQLLEEGADGHFDDVSRYRKVIRDLIQAFAQYQPSRGEVQIEVILDEANDHYELMYAGWNGPYRIHGSVLHLDIRDGKVWIQHDGTEEGIAEKLVSAGIPRDRIVLAFKSPDIRPHTGYATT